MNSTRYQTLELGDNDGQYRDVDTDRDASSSKNEQVLKYFRGVLIVTFASTLLLLGFWAAHHNLRAQASIANLTNDEKFLKVIHISDSHIDPLFDPFTSMNPGQCHTCTLSTPAYGKDRACPQRFLPTRENITNRISLGYSFGRYGCNPPHLLWSSLHNQMLEIDPEPKVIIFTGDISPHGYPDDDFKLKADTKLEDLCDTKFLVTQHMVADMVKAFPNTKWAFTLGNNDHFPKDVYWQPYIDKFGKMLYDEGFFTAEQYDQFVNNGGSNYIDVDGIRYVSIDFTLFVDGGEIPDISAGKKADAHFLYPIRHKVVEWTDATLADAKAKGLKVYIIGHQPLSTKKGKDELDVSGLHYAELKVLFTKYQKIIEAGFFGHRNLAGLAEVLSPNFLPLFPAMTAPGVSPRGNNQPSFNVIYINPETKVVMDFEQYKFHLLDENQIAKQKMDPEYLGTWSTHRDNLRSWRTISGEKEFTEVSLERFLKRLTTNEADFFAIQRWKTGGFVGEETPESYACKALYDVEEAMMFCLFPHQDVKCWNNKWLS